MNSPVSRFTIRTLRSEDMDACHAIHEGSQAVDGPSIQTTPEEMISGMDHPRFGRDTSWVAEMDGRVVAYLENFINISDPADSRFVFDLLVHPECRRCGIGTVLWNKGLEACRSKGFQWYGTSAYSTSTSGIHFLEKKGAWYDISMWKMHMPREDFRPGPREHAATIRHFQDDSDYALIARMWNETFFEHWGFSTSVEADTRHLGKGPFWNPEIVLFAEMNGQAMGMCRNEISPENEGWIEVLGVKPEARGTGLGRFLLDRSIERMVERGATSLSLNVMANNEGALQLYRSSGFEPQLEKRIYRLDCRLG